MILDDKLEICDATSVALTAGATPQNVGDVIDFDAARELGNGETMYLVITCQAQIITGGVAGTIQFRLVSDSTASISTDGTESLHWASDTFVTDDAALAELTDGEIVAVVPLPNGAAREYERYLGLQVIVATTNTTAGSINAFLTKDPTGWKAYPNAAGA